MEYCPICKSVKSDSDSLCQCGYDFGKQEITNPERIKEYHTKIKNTEHWIEEARLIESVHETQQKKHEATRPGRRGGWGLAKTADILDKSTSYVEDHVKLAMAIDVFPELQRFENKTRALHYLSKLSAAPFAEYFGKQFASESELQKYLVDNWDNTEFHNEWDLRESQYKVQNS